MQRRRSRRRSWGSSLRRFAPAYGCRGVSRRPATRAHDSCESRWRLRDRSGFRPFRAHVSLAARPRPTVSVGGSTELIGFAKARSIEDSRLDFWASLPSAVRARRRSSFAAGRSCLGLRRLSRVLRDDRCVPRTGDSDAFTVRSVSCEAHVVRPRTGRVRRVGRTSTFARHVRRSIRYGAAVVCV